MQASIGFYGIRQGNTSLQHVYENNLNPLVDLQEIDFLSKEIRFRMAAVLLGQMPSVGSTIHLQEARKVITERWQQFISNADATKKNSDQQELLKKLANTLDKRWPAILDKLEKAYQNRDTDTLEELLEDEWAEIIVGLSKPIEDLLPYFQEGVKNAYMQSLQDGTTISWLLLGAVLIGIPLFLSIIISTTVSFQREFRLSFIGSSRI